MKRLVTTALALALAPALALTLAPAAGAGPLRLRADALAATAAPVGLLVLDASDRERPWLESEALVWLGDGDTARADVLVIAVALRDPRGRGLLRLGRQVIVAGALRPVHLDGADGRARLPGAIDVQAFGGIPVVPGFGAAAYDWAAGVRVSRGLGAARVGAGWLQERLAGALSGHEVAVDAAWLVAPHVDLAAGGAWDLAGDGLAKADASAAWRRRGLRVELFAMQRSATHLLPATSLFTVLGDTAVVRAGTAVRWRAAPRLDVRATLDARRASDVLDRTVDAEATAEARLALDDRDGSHLSVELRRQGSAADGWTGVRGAGHLALTEAWIATLELELVRPDDPRGRGDLWPWGLAALAWRPAFGWELAAAVEGRASPEDRWRVDALARLARQWEAP